MPKVRRILLTAVGAVLLAASIAAAQPVPQSASYDEVTNVLTVTFDHAVKTVASNIIIDGMRIDDDNGGANEDYALRGGTVLNTSATGSNLRLRLIFPGVIDSYDYTLDNGEVETRNCWGQDDKDAVKVETTLLHSSMRLYLPAGCVVGADNQPNAGGWVDLAYDATPENEKIHLDRIAYDARTNTLRFEFDHVMQFDQIAEDIGCPAPPNHDPFPDQRWWELYRRPPKTDDEHVEDFFSFVEVLSDEQFEEFSKEYGNSWEATLRSGGRRWK